MDPGILPPSFYRCTFDGCSARRSARPYMHQKLYNVKRHVWNTHCRSAYVEPYNEQYECLKKRNMISSEMEREIVAFVSKCDGNGLVVGGVPKSRRRVASSSSQRVPDRVKSARPRDEEPDAAPVAPSPSSDRPAKSRRTEAFASPGALDRFEPFQFDAGVASTLGEHFALTSGPQPFAQPFFASPFATGPPVRDDDVLMDGVAWLTGDMAAVPESPSLSPEYSLSVVDSDSEDFVFPLFA